MDIMVSFELWWNHSIGRSSCGGMFPKQPGKGFPENFLVESVSDRRPPSKSSHSAAQTATLWKAHKSQQFANENARARADKIAIRSKWAALFLVWMGSGLSDCIYSFAGSSKELRSCWVPAILQEAGPVPVVLTVWSDEKIWNVTW